MLLSDEVGVRACEAFELRLCMGAGAWVIKWGDISAVSCVHGKCARCVNNILGQRLPVAQAHALGCARGERGVLWYAYAKHSGCLHVDFS